MLWRLLFIVAVLLPERTALADARLGASMNDFRSAWGRAARQEQLVRTATAVWKFDGQKNAILSPGIFEADVSFFDGIACQIVLRSAQPLTKDKSAKLAKTLLPRFQASDLAKLKSKGRDGRTYALSSGGYITLWAEEKPAVMVIRSKLFLRNNEVFDREAAKVRPPTSNH
jgi:hypothetical protein